MHRRHLTSSQRAALSSDVVKELELEAKEKQRENAQRLNKSLGRGETNEQMFAHSSFEQSDLEPQPSRSPTTHTTTSSGKSTAKATQKSKSGESEREAQSREKAAQLLGTNHDYISKIKKLESLERTDLLAKVKTGELSVTEAKKQADKDAGLDRRTKPLCTKSA